jgi:TonB family protein
MMSSRLLLAGLMAFIVRGAVPAGPSEFYIVSAFFSDNGALFYYRVIDVRGDGSDTLIRYIRVAPASVLCPRIIVQAAVARVPAKSPADLVGGKNPCGVEQSALNKAVAKYPRRESVFEAISFGLVAQCGSSSVSLRLPMGQTVDLKKMQKAYPDMARLWQLASSVADAVFGPKDIFHDRSEAEDMEMQRAAETLMPELRSGHFDAGLSMALNGNVGSGRSATFRDLLASYRGPINAGYAKIDFAPRLLNAQSFWFTHFVLPNYPVLAIQARIEGNVELQLTVDPANGEVRSAAALSGHQLLKSSAIEAAKQWRFEPNSVASGSVTVSLDFSLTCR